MLRKPNLRLTRDQFHKALDVLARRDPDLNQVLRDYGPPPLWSRKPGFVSLTQIILEQQVSLASARATFRKLKSICDPLAPDQFLELSDKALRAAGFSRQKTRYVRNLAQAVLNRSLDLQGLAKMDDHSARAKLLRITGIGPWTADIYLLMALRRPDIWPDADLALVTGVHELKGLPGKPDSSAHSPITSKWKPWRSVAARLVWHYYLSSPRS